MSFPEVHVESGIEGKGTRRCWGLGKSRQLYEADEYGVYDTATAKGD